MYFFISAFVTLAHVGSNLKSLNHEINFKEKIGPKNYSREKISDPRILTRKFGPTKYPREKNFGPMKYPREKILDPRNTHEKNLGLTKYPRRHGGTMAINPRDPPQHATHEI